MSLLATAREVVANFIYPEGVERRDRAERDAETDALTGLANRRALSRALPAAERDPLTSVCLFDANNFGLVNKRCGHEKGDVLLVLVARCIERAASRYGYGVRVFRSGGDEFLVLCHSRVADELCADAECEFGTHDICEGVRVSLTGSIGATFREADMGLQSKKEKSKRRS
ncbi:MAG: GGDEF domain-containing protein [Pyrinomonadaceae bacterium]